MENRFDFQFYPTPASLATKAWGKFKNKNFTRILEPSAGLGDLIKNPPWSTHYNHRCLSIDCVEVDLAKHPTLRSLPGVSVVGMDFMHFQGGACYSHILMNPPFASGCSHILKAWDVLFDGEIVCILNAETIRNAFSRERQHLLALIEAHGEVEYIEQAFAGDDVQRSTSVEIALVYLRKKTDAAESIVGSIIDGLVKDNAKLKAERLAQGYEQMQELMIPSTAIENSVMSFDAAVAAMRASVMAEARADYYSGMLGDTMAVRSGGDVGQKMDASVGWVRNSITERFLKLKDRAWASILRSSQVTSKLSSQAQKRVESEFESIKELEFTVQNVYGFLCGLLENQNQIQLDMACDIFDLITRYHSENSVWYKGWVSNSLHRTAGMRIKTTRFVIPGNANYSGSRNLSWDAEKRLSDIDKVFAMLDGKSEPEVSLTHVFRHNSNQMAVGGRVSASYFDVRWYPGAGTIHFFPRDKALVDRLNRLVGEHRKWLPPADASVSKTFWQQYEQAEKFDKDLRAEIDNRQRGASRSRWDNPLTSFCGRDDDKKSGAAIDDALTAVLERRGISVDFQLQESGSDRQEQLLLLAA